MNKLINLEIKILFLYNKLFRLDIDGKKNSLKYNRVLAELKKLIEQEEGLLKLPVIRDITEKEFEELLKVASSINSNVEARIMTRLTGILVENISKEAGAFEEGIKIDRVLEEVQTNVMLFYAKYLYDIDLDSYDDDFRRKLLVEFYNLCYVEPRVGNLLLNDSFEVRDDYFRSCYFVADLYGMKRCDSQQVIDEACAELLKDNIMDSLYSVSKRINFSLSEFDYIMLLCMSKAIRTIMSEEAFLQFKEEFLSSVYTENLLENFNCALLLKVFGDEAKPANVTTITAGKPLIKTKEKE